MSELFVFGVVVIVALVVIGAMALGRGLSIKFTPQGHLNVKVDKPGGE